MLKDTQDTKNRRGTEGCLVGHSNTLSEAEHRKLNCRPTSQMVEIHPPRNSRLRVSTYGLLTYKWLCLLSKLELSFQF